MREWRMKEWRMGTGCSRIGTGVIWKSVDFALTNRQKLNTHTHTLDVRGWVVRRDIAIVHWSLWTIVSLHTHNNNNNNNSSE